MRKTPVGSIQGAMRKAVTAAGGIECAAGDLGISTSLVSRGTNPNEDAYRGGLGVTHVDALCRMHTLAARYIAGHFALLAGGSFVLENHAPSKDVSAVMAEFAAVLKNHSAAFSEKSKDPTKFTPEEAAQALDAINAFGDDLSAYKKYVERCLKGLA